MIDELDCRKQDGLTWLTLNRPQKANALNRSLVEALLGEVDKASMDGTRMIIFQGAGRALCSGFDLSTLDTESEGETAVRFLRVERLLQAIYHAPCLTVALGHGRTFGAGADLFCACRWRVAAPDATFCMPGLRFGIVLGTRRLAQRVGQDVAQRLLLEVHTITAGEALEIGFATECLAQEEWPALVERAYKAAQILDPDAAERMFGVSTTDTRAVDMADLALSVTEPHLQERIRRYREALRAGRDKTAHTQKQ